MASLSFEHEQVAFQQYYSLNYQTFQDAEIQFRTLIASLLAQAGSFAEIPKVISRVKAEAECISKFQRKYQTELEKQQAAYEIKDYISDLIGVRVTCLYESDVPEVARVLSDNFRSLGVTDKIATLESTDDAFGYRGLHLDLAINEARRELPEYGKYRDFHFEVQIRTIIQDGWSILDHKMKYKRAIPIALKRRINVLAALFELADHEFLAIREATRSLELRAREQVSAENAGASAITDVVSAGEDEPFLNVFQFLEIAASHFPHYPFRADRADVFVQEMLRWKPDLTAQDLSTLLAAHLPVVERYAQYNRLRSYSLNPFTQMRHALFLSDQAGFRWMLYDLQRHSFGAWLESNDRTVADQPRIVSADTNRARELVRESMAHYRCGRYLEGVAFAEQAIRLDPALAGAWRSVATNLGQLGEHERARDAWRTVDRLLTDVPMNYEAMSHEALKSVRADWASTTAWEQLAMAFEREGRGRDAVAEARAIMETNPEVHASLVPLVERLVSLYPEEIGALVSDMRANAPAEAHYAHLYGLSQRKAGRNQEAIPYLRTACEAMPANANYWYGLGRALEDSGDVVAACVAFRNAVTSQSPPHRKAEERLAALACAP